jgi:hypothetical protein
MANIANNILITGLETLNEGTTNPAQVVFYRDQVWAPLWVVADIEALIASGSTRTTSGQVWPRGNS